MDAALNARSGCQGPPAFTGHQKRHCRYGAFEALAGRTVECLCARYTDSLFEMFTCGAVQVNGHCGECHPVQTRLRSRHDLVVHFLYGVTEAPDLTRSLGGEGSCATRRDHARRHLCMR